MPREGKPNFNKRKSFNTFWHSHYITFSTYHRRKYLFDDRICEALANRINEASKKHNFAVLAFDPQCEVLNPAKSSAFSNKLPNNGTKVEIKRILEYNNAKVFSRSSFRAQRKVLKK